MRYRQETRADNSDVLIVAGDVADDPEVLIDCLASLREAYGGGVVFVPGNHDLWQTGSRREGAARAHVRAREHARRSERMGAGAAVRARACVAAH